MRACPLTARFPRHLAEKLKGCTCVPIGWSRGYARNGVTSSYAGHPSKEAAIRDALDCLRSRGVTSAWVRPVYSGARLGDVVWSKP
jgi:hypothetical protein